VVILETVEHGRRPTWTKDVGLQRRRRRGSTPILRTVPQLDTFIPEFPNRRRAIAEDHGCGAARQGCSFDLQRIFRADPWRHRLRGRLDSELKEGAAAIERLSAAERRKRSTGPYLSGSTGSTRRGEGTHNANAEHSGFLVNLDAPVLRPVATRWLLSPGVRGRLVACPAQGADSCCRDPAGRRVVGGWFVLD